MQRTSDAPHPLHKKLLHYLLMTTYLPNFPLARPAKLSQHLIDRGITHFHAAITYVKELPYRRNGDPRDWAGLLRSGGTFTARHALLVQVAREQGVADLGLTLCVHALDRERWPGVDRILSEHELPDFPEIQGCLRYGRQLLAVEEPTGLKSDVVSAVDIAPVQIGNFKRRYHLRYLTNWRQLEKLDRWSTEQLWQVREQCLTTVAQHWNQRRQPLAA